MALSKPKAILRLYNETLKNGIECNENEEILNIVQNCEKQGKYLFHIDSYWSFVKSIWKQKPCIRMIFAIKENEGGKVQNIDRIVEIIRDTENVLLYIDNIDIIKSEKFIYLDVIKIIRNENLKDE